MNEQKLKTIESILEQSDIVWPRYGSDSIEDLAEKILLALEEKD